MSVGRYEDHELEHLLDLADQVCPSTAKPSVILHTYVRSLHCRPLENDDRLQLPQQLGWSATEATLESTAGAPVSLVDLRRKANATALLFVQHRQECPEWSAAAIRQFFASDTWAWWDTEAYVNSYRRLVSSPGSFTHYDRSTAPSGPHTHLPLEHWWDLHKDACPECAAHHARWGSYSAAVEHGDDLKCHFVDILAWLAGNWRIPLQARPKPGKRPNYPSLFFEPHAMEKECHRMKQWGVLVPGEPVLAHATMGVIRDSDLLEACRLLRSIGRPSPSEDKKEIRLINDHIATVLAEGPPIPPELGTLKPVKVRYCVDASILLNPLVKRWHFPYATVHDAVKLLQPQWFMSKLDLEKYFNQLPLHPDDWLLLGVRIPDDFSDPTSPLRSYLSAYAQFGGSPFPALANAIMSAVSAILRSHGIPNVFLTDDIFVCGATREECQANVDKAIAIIRHLGLKLQMDKVPAPSQRMTFLGILLDTVLLRMSIPLEKIDNYLVFLRHLLDDHAGGRLKATDLESLLGKLGWIAEVMIAGRARLRSLRDCLPSGWYVARRSASTVLLSPQAQADVQWWIDYLLHARGHPYWVPFWTSALPIRCRTFSDASGDIGFGLACGPHLFQGQWAPITIPKSSGFKELVPILLALVSLGDSASGRIVVVTTDNLSNVLAINKGVCKSRESAAVLNVIIELAAARQAYLIADWAPREEIEFVDAVSRETWTDPAHLVWSV